MLLIRNTICADKRGNSIANKLTKKMHAGFSYSSIAFTIDEMKIVNVIEKVIF